jgi:septal ring factor EnvC (AmiA/AmiB activator)
VNSEKKITLKKQKVLNIALCSLLIVLSLFTIHYSLSTAAYAQSTQEKYGQIQKNLKTQKKKLESVRKVEKSVLDELRKTNADLNEIESQLSAQRGKIRKIQNNISALQITIDNNKKSLEMQSDLLKKRLRAFQRISKGDDAFLIIISSHNISQTLRTLRYISDISAYDYKLINKYKETVQVLSEKQDELKKLFAELKTEEAKMSELEGALKEEKKERETLLVSVRKEKKNYEKMIKELQEASSRLLEIIQKSEKREKEQRKRKGAKLEDKEKEPEGDSDFARLKGRLPWPVDGSVAIQYGTQVDPIFNLPVFRSGIHIKTSNNSHVKAVHKGKVVFADYFKGYGQIVIISHSGGYHSLYGNLSKIFLKNGVIIKEDTTIGEVGESSAIGASGLYFEIRYRGKPLDPQQWLRK